jgi:hypothetical protein
MKRLFLTLGIFAALMLVAAPAFAVTVTETATSTSHTGGLHFTSSPTLTATKTRTEAYLTATGEVAGAGTTATAMLSSDAVVTRGCINRGSKDQQPSGLQTTSETTTGSTTFHTRAGRGSFTVETSPHIEASDFSCPDQMVPVLVSVTFTNIVLAVTSQTGTATATFADIDP